MTGARVVPLLLMLAVGAALGLTIGMSLRPAAPSPPPPVRTPPREEPRPAPVVETTEEPEVVEPPFEPIDEPERPSPVNLAARLRSAVVRAGSADALRDDVRAIVLEEAAGRPIEDGPAWLLADAAASAGVLEALLEAAGIELDAASRETLGDLARRIAIEMAVARDHEGPTTAGRALRRAAEAALEAGLLEILHSEQERMLREALRGRPVADLLPGGRDGNVLGSTGADRARVETLVLGTYRDRIGLADEPHPGVRRAVSAYVDAVATLDRDLEARYGRGLVEAVCSGPSAHTEAAREARRNPDYGRRELEARAAYWRLQAEFEGALEPYLDEEQRERLRDRSPAGLRFTVLEEDRR